MNWFDIILVLIVVSSAFAGLRAGLVRVLTHSIAIVGALLSAFAFYSSAGWMLRPWIASLVAANIAGFAVVFFGVMILGWLIGFMLSRSFEWVGLGWLDHLLGGIAGLVRGALLAGIVISTALAFTSDPPPAYLSQSWIVPYAASASAVLAELAPKPMREAFEEAIERLRHRVQRPSKAQGTA